MISIRSRAVSWILTLTLVFTTVFGSTGMAFAGEGSAVAEFKNTQYDTLQAAIDAAEAEDSENITIDLIADATLDITAWETLAIGGENTKTITINGGDHKLTFNKKNSDWNHVVTKNKAKLILNEMTIADSGYNNGPWNRHDIVFACDVALNEVLSERALAFKAGADLNKVTIKDNNAADTYAIWIQPNGQTVTLNECLIDMLDATDGRGIKIDEQYVDAAKLVTLNVAETVFKTEEKSAILVKSTAGADITLNNVDITNVVADSINAVWIDEDSTDYADKVVVTGGSVIDEDVVAAIVENESLTGYYKSLQAAFDAAKNGDEVTIFKAGTYALGTSGKDITITGAVDGVVFDNIGAKNMGGASVTFNNVTFTYAGNSTYKGLQHSGDMTYNNCTFKGQVFLYGNSETFKDCTFEQDSPNYNVWTYGAKEVTFENCTFISAGKSVLIYAESAGIFNDVTVTGCEFVASAEFEGKAAIEMDSSLTAGIDLTIDATTTAAGFGKGNVSNNSLWNNKKGNKGLNNDITVVVGENVVLAPNAPVIEGVEEGKTYYKEAAYKVLDDTAIVTINDEKADLEGAITEAGTYTIVATDEVGHTTAVTFTIEAEHEYEWDYVAEINVEDIDFTNAEEVAKVLTHAKKCACGEVDETTVDLHDFEVEVTKEPTKEDPNGEATLFCATCGYEETKTFEEIADITAYLVAEYYDEAYAYAYAYADEEGYIDATIEGIDAVVAALDEALAVANESGMSDELKAELNAAYENVITTADQLKVLIETADVLDDATYAEAVKLLAELEKNLNDFCSIMEQAGLDAADQLWIAYEYVKPIIIEQLKLAVEAGTAWLMDIMGELFDAFIAALPAIDKALYDWFYNNPEVVIGFFYEYGDEFGYLFEEYGDELACVLSYVLATYGPEAVEWALENPEEALAKWVEWYNKHGVRALAMIDKYIRTLDEMGAFDGIKASLKDFAAEVEAFIVDYAEKVVAALEAKYNELSDAAQAALAELKAAIESMDIEAILAAMEELEAEIAALYKDATTGDYIVTGDSYYVALGDTETEYAQIVADEMKLDGEQFVNAGIPGITAEELADLLASGEEDLIAEIAKADFITVGFSNNTITAYAKDQVADLMAKNAEEVDWDAVVGPNGAAAVEEALVDLEAALVAEGLGEAAELVVTAVEAYAYACISFASNYPEVIDEIKAINADAEVVIVGMYNPFENAVLDVEGTQIPVGEFVGALVDLANIHYTAYAMLTGNATYVAAPAVETKAPFGEAMGIEEFVATLADLDAMEPSEAGNVYIAEQILKAMNVVDKDVYNFQKLIDEIKAFGDVTRENLTDAKALAEAARAAWDALTDEEKALIGLDVYKVLVDFELEIAKVELGIAEDIEAAEKALAEAQAKAADIERALKITESTVTDLKAKVQNKSQIKVTWEAAEVTPDQYRVTLMRAGKKVGTYWVAGDKESVVLKNMLRGTNFKVRVTPVAKFEGKKYFSIYKTSNKVVTKLQKANLTVKKAGAKKQIISKDQNSTGFQIYISKDKNFKKDVKKLVYKTNKKGLNVKVKAKNFKKGANYVKVRAYTKVNGKTVYGAWSGTVKVVK